MHALQSLALVTMGLAASAASAEAVLRPGFTHLTVEDGLPNNTVLAIAKDHRGFLWFGTSDGLARYDGSGFVVHRHRPEDPHSIPPGEVSALFEDSRGRFWVGTVWAEQSGLARFDRTLNRFDRFQADARAGSRCDPHVQTIVEDAKGLLWIGSESGLQRLDPQSETCVPYRIPGPPVRVTSIVEDGDARLLVGSERGLFVFDRNRSAFEAWRGPSPGGASLAETGIRDLHRGRDGSLWIATNGAGLVRLRGSGSGSERFLPDRRGGGLSVSKLTRLASDGAGRLFVGTENGGLDVLDTGLGRFTHFRPEVDDDASLSSLSVKSLLYDAQGLLWVATYHGGVDCLSFLGRRFRTWRASRGGLSDPHVTSVAEDARGDLWIGTDGGGLNRLDRRTGRFAWYRFDPSNDASLGSDSVQGVVADPDGTVWVAGWNAGLSRLDVRTGRVRRHRHDPADARSLGSDDAWRLLPLGPDAMLVATLLGADLFDKRRGTFCRLAERYPISAAGPVFTAALDARGDLWLGRLGFVERVEQRTARVTRYEGEARGADAFLGRMVQALVVDSRGNVWIGTESGLTCLAAGGAGTLRYTEADGLPGPDVTNVLEDEAGDIWITTSGGVARLEGATRPSARLSVRSFDVHDGLQGRAFTRGAALRSASGELFFGGSKGLSAFFPDQIRRNNFVPPVVLTGLRLFNRSLEVGTPGSPVVGAIEDLPELTLAHDQSMITFEFAALSYVLPQKNRYAYRMEGLDGDWRTTLPGQRSATYSRVPAGRYVFHVRGSNNDGVWNEEGARLRLVVTPPFWATRRFAALVAVLGIAGIVAAHRLRLRQTRARFHAVMDERRRLSQDLHDTIEQGLAGIALQLDTALAFLSRNTETVGQCLESALHMVRYSREEAQRTVMELRSQALQRGDLGRALEEIGSELTRNSAVTVTMRRSGAPRPLPAAVEHHIFRVGQEALTNAVKHAQARSIVVELRYAPGEVELCVSDDGRGFSYDPQAVRSGFGLSGMRERARKVAGRLDVKSAPGQGTTIHTAVPLG